MPEQMVLPFSEDYNQEGEQYHSPADPEDSGGPVAEAGCHSVKHWVEETQPIHKLLYKGRNSISDLECLAIVIGQGNADKNCMELAQAILAMYKWDLKALARTTVPELMQIKGIGRIKASQIIASFELGKRRIRNDIKDW